MGTVKPGAINERDFGDDKTGMFDREDDLGTRPGSAAAVKALAPDPAPPAQPKKADKKK